MDLADRRDLRQEAAAGAMAPALQPLLALGLEAALLEELSRRARRYRVPAGRVLLNAGVLQPLAFASALGTAWEVPLMIAPLPLAGEATLAALGEGVVRLADGRWLVSVDSTRLDTVAALSPDWRREHLVLCYPAAFQALIRRLLWRGIADEASDGLARRHPGMSCREPPRRFQVIAAGCAATWVAGAALLPDGPLMGLGLMACAVVFLAAILLHALLMLEPVRPPDPPGLLPDEALPTYGVLVPLCREARMVPQLVATLKRLDYPVERLDIRFLIEHDDTETHAALNLAALPAWMQVVVVPPGSPRTKPRALNAGLIGMTAEFVAVYDAEDDPEPDQLRRAAGRFFRSDPSVACLQAHLAIDNVADTWLTALFAAEYAALFDVIKPALAECGLPVPLGGTSNHFRRRVLEELGGWDAWNVTEDADLGIRLARAGYRVGDLASTTYEEAPVSVRAWLRQRRRWLKGWMQTLLTHTRAPLVTARQLGLAGTLAAVATLGNVLLGTLGFPVLSWLFVKRLLVLHDLGAGGPLNWLTDAVALLVFVAGAGCMAAPALLGLRRRNLFWLAPWVLLLPLYSVLASLAAWLALYEFFIDPFRWNKTEHGLSRTSRLRPGRDDQQPSHR